MILLNHIADPLDIELLELLNYQSSALAEALLVTWLEKYSI